MRNHAFTRLVRRMASAFGSAGRRRGVAAACAVALTTSMTVGMTAELAGPAAAATDPQCTTSALLVPGCGVLTGMATYKVAGQTWEQSVAAYETKSGSPTDVLHNYHTWTTTFPDAAEKARADAGQKLLITWIGERDNGQVVRWADIANGSQDAVIDAQAASVKAFGRPIWVNFQNEPEAFVGTRGSAADFVAAWRRIHDRFVAAGATNAVWTLVYMGVADSQSFLAKTAALYPGDDYVDWIGWDPYNRASCNGLPWKDFRQTVKPFYDWLMTNGHADKPFMLAEYGSVEDPNNPNARADWFTGAGDALVNGEFPNLKVVSYFDHPAPPATCDWRVETSPTTLASFRGFTSRMKTFSTTWVSTPSAPLSAVATPAAGSAVVRWQPPRSSGDGVITSYTVTANPGGATVVVPGPNPITSAAMAGLNPAVNYTFTVAATNAAGTGVASAATAVITPKASTTAISDPAAGGWKLNGRAVLADGGVRLTDAVTTESKATAWWPTAIPSASSVAVTFTSTIDGGTGADGTALVFGDASAGAKPTSLGNAGGGLGWSGVPGFAVAVDTYKNGVDPSANFVGVATGWQSATPKNLTWGATRDMRDTLRGQHAIGVVVAGGTLYLTVDGVQAVATRVTLSGSTLLGFSAGQGGRTDRHLVTDVRISTS